MYGLAVECFVRSKTHAASLKTFQSAILAARKGLQMLINISRNIDDQHIAAPALGLFQSLANSGSCRNIKTNARRASPFHELFKKARALPCSRKINQSQRREASKTDRPRIVFCGLAQSIEHPLLAAIFPHAQKIDCHKAANTRSLQDIANGLSRLKIDINGPRALVAAPASPTLRARRIYIDGGHGLGALNNNGAAARQFNAPIHKLFDLTFNTSPFKETRFNDNSIQLTTKAAALGDHFNVISLRKIIDEILQRFNVIKQRITRLCLIGALQKNKIKYIVGSAVLVHSVDSLALAQALSGRCLRDGVPPIGVLLQVNLAGEASKGGTTRSEALALARKVQALPGVALRGLMTIPPFSADPQESAPWFSGLASLAAEGRSEGLPLTELSMGMSGDLEIAVAHGATIVRVGTAIFGRRSY